MVRLALRGVCPHQGAGHQTCGIYIAQRYSYTTRNPGNCREGTKTGRLRQRFSFVLQQAPSFRSRQTLGDACKQSTASTGRETRHLQNHVPRRNGPRRRRRGREGGDRRERAPSNPRYDRHGAECVRNEADANG